LCFVPCCTLLVKINTSIPLLKRFTSTNTNLLFAKLKRLSLVLQASTYQ
jgi:hypothetical protein